VVGTHHVGASTRQAQEAVADGVEEIINAFARGELLHVVNNPAQRTAQQAGQHVAQSGAAR
jgi:D-3-phosphoglycerate dehydrogenase